jgi:3-deoxy-D-manno-octulosonate 8-phosphate phosphatase (KDO 8-P phosphatase)
VPLEPTDLAARAARVRLMLFDVDGVFTDATIQLAGDGHESKRFSIRDGSAVIWARRAGLDVGLLSGRPSAATARRAAELGITVVHQEGPDKSRAYARILTDLSLEDAQVSYMGDDLLDLPILRRVGLSAAPLDAVEEVRQRVDWISQAAGGSGAVREFIELVLKATGRWDSLVASYLE